MPDPQWVVSINAVIYSSITLISHHTFNSLYLNPFCHVTNSVDLILKRSIRKGTCGGHWDVPPFFPFNDGLSPSGAGGSIVRQLSAPYGIVSTAESCLTQGHTPSLGGLYLMTDQNGDVKAYHRALT